MRKNPVIAKYKSSYRRVDARGEFVEYFNNTQSWKSINGGSMKKGAVMGNHYHKKNLALFIVISGSVKIVAYDVREKRPQLQGVVLKASEGAVIYPFATHAVKFLEPSTFLFLKSKKYSEGNKDLFPTKHLID